MQCCKASCFTLAPELCLMEQLCSQPADGSGDAPCIYSLVHCREPCQHRASRSQHNSAHSTRPRQGRKNDLPELISVVRRRAPPEKIPGWQMFIQIVLVTENVPGWEKVEEVVTVF